ncbi:triose-phosphate transporter family-domain-containing protein [Paraphysoderma sedebokerense]|nr:triose-phosphate transporter family-domain-containing protein [Paraphysoderma sedebokerense]
MNLWNFKYIFLWYIFSTLLSVYNKYLFGISAFHYPLFTTSFHMFTQFLLSYVILTYFKPELMPPKVSVGSYIRYVAPCAFATGLDIGLSNMSFKTITLSFYTMVKSSVPFWTLVFSFALKLEKPTLELGGIMCIILIGVFLMVLHEASFVFIGFIQILTASIFAGLRVCLTQTLLHGPSQSSQSPRSPTSFYSESKYPRPALHNPLATTLYLAPLMSATLLFTSLFNEDMANLATNFSTPNLAAYTSGLLLAGAFLAFVMVWAELQVIKVTSGLSFTIAGIVKECGTILVGVIVFGDKVGFVNWIGVGITTIGVGLYNWWKWKKLTSRRQGAGGEGGNGEGGKEEYFVLDEFDDEEVVFDLGLDDDDGGDMNHRNGSESTDRTGGNRGRVSSTSDNVYTKHRNPSPNRDTSL